MRRLRLNIASVSLIALFSVLHLSLLPARALAESSSADSETAPEVTELLTPSTNAPIEIPAMPKKDADRAEKSGGADAMAMAGAAFSMVMCMKMMNDARKMPPGEEKNNTQMMAAMQCAQAAKNAADGKKNGENKDQLTQEDVPKMPTLASKGEFKNPQPVKEDKLPATPTISEPSAVAELPEVSPIQAPTIKPADLGTNGKTAAEPADAFSTLAAIEDNGLRFNELSKGGGTTPFTQLPYAPSAFQPNAQGTALNSNDLKKLGDQAQADARGAKRRMGAKEEEAGGTAGESDSSSKGGEGTSEDPFKGMLDKLMGGGGAAEGSEYAGVGGEILDMTAGPGTARTGAKPPVNIFAYANYRYKVAAYTDGMVRVRAPERAVASTPKAPADEENVPETPAFPFQPSEAHTARFE